MLVMILLIKGEPLDGKQLTPTKSTVYLYRSSTGVSIKLKITWGIYTSVHRFLVIESLAFKTQTCNKQVILIYYMYFDTSLYCT